MRSFYEISGNSDYFFTRKISIVNIIFGLFVLINITLSFNAYAEIKTEKTIQIQSLYIIFGQDIAHIVWSLNPLLIVWLRPTLG